MIWFVSIPSDDMKAYGDEHFSMILLFTVENRLKTTIFNGKKALFGNLTRKNREFRVPNPANLLAM